MTCEDLVLLSLFVRVLLSVFVLQWPWSEFSRQCSSFSLCPTPVNCAFSRSDAPHAALQTPPPSALTPSPRQATPNTHPR